MIPDFEDTVQTANRALFLIATMSPLAATSIELELYRQTADSDGSSEQYVLEDAFSHLIKDLTNIGITVNTDYSDLVENMGALFPFLTLCSYLLPNTLYDRLKSDVKLRECFDHFLMGNLGDEETLIQTYLSELGGLDGQIPLHPEMTQLCDQYYPILAQTETFTDYCKQLMELLSHEKMSIEIDPDRQVAYTAKLRGLIGRLSDAIQIYEGWAVYDNLLTMQNNIIQDFISPDNFTEYSYLLLETEDTLPESLIPRYRTKAFHYVVSHPWCPEYYLLRKEIPAELSYPIFACFLYADNPNKKDFEAIIAKWDYKFRNTITEARVLKLYDGEPISG